MSDRMIFCPNSPMSRPSFTVPHSVLPNWKYRLRVSIWVKGLSQPVPPPQLGSLGRPTTSDLSLIPGAKPTWALMSSPSTLVVNTKLIQPGSRPLVSAESVVLTPARSSVRWE